MIGKYTEEDGKKLLKLARESIEQGFDREKKINLPEEKQFRQARGVFVTLTKKGELRGCIGYPEAVYSVSEAVLGAAKSAAFSDPRFLPLNQDELADIKLEVSVLTEMQEMKDKKNIKIGEDGLVIKYLGYSGLLLPQVAIEWKMSQLQFLEAIARKAGLDKDRWMDDKAKLFKFQAQIFSE